MTSRNEPFNFAKNLSQSYNDEAFLIRSLYKIRHVSKGGNGKQERGMEKESNLSFSVALSCFLSLSLSHSVPLDQI